MIVIISGHNFKMYVKNLFNVPIFRKPRREVLASDIEKLKNHKGDGNNPTALRVIGKKAKEILQIDGGVDEREEIRRRLPRPDTAAVLREFERGERERRRRLRKLLEKNGEELGRAATRPAAQRVRQNRLFQHTQDCEKLEADEARLVGRLTNKLRES